MVDNDKEYWEQYFNSNLSLTTVYLSLESSGQEKVSNNLLRLEIKAGGFEGILFFFCSVEIYCVHEHLHAHLAPKGCYHWLIQERF